MRWLIDEMVPPATAVELLFRGHDAVSVADADLAGAPDAVIYDRAVEGQRLVVTENFSDFAALAERRMAAEEPCVPVVFVRKQDCLRRGGLTVHLARRLDQWAAENPDPILACTGP